jgi:hypothetical protein
MGVKTPRGSDLLIFSCEIEIIVHSVAKRHQGMGGMRL